MKKTIYAAALAFTLSQGAALAQEAGLRAPVETAAPQTVYATFMNAGGMEAGKATVTAAPNGLLFRVYLHDLTPGWHGLHVHGAGDCSDHAEHFKKSGSHHAREGQEHGYLSAKGPHSGDLPNIWVHTDGTAQAEIYTAGLTLAELTDADGSALMVHATADNYAAQPSGDSGERLACAVVR